MMINREKKPVKTKLLSPNNLPTKKIYLIPRRESLTVRMSQNEKQATAVKYVIT